MNLLKFSAKFSALGWFVAVTRAHEKHKGVTKTRSEWAYQGHPPTPPNPHHLPISETVGPPKSHEFHGTISNNPYTLLSSCDEDCGVYVLR